MVVPAISNGEDNILWRKRWMGSSMSAGLFDEDEDGKE